VGGDENEMTE